MSNGNKNNAINTRERDVTIKKRVFKKFCF